MNLNFFYQGRDTLSVIQDLFTHSWTKRVNKDVLLYLAVEQCVCVRVHQPCVSNTTHWIMNHVCAT